MPTTNSEMLNHFEYSGDARCSIPNDHPIIATTNKMKPPKSNVLTEGSFKLGMTFNVINMPKIPIGILMRKIQCQVATSTNQPPKVGPAKGPSKPARLIKLIAAKN
ncbi:hypothetical protein D9M71_347210 [compost metagenome]